MSQENLDLVRRSVEAFNDRDIAAVESMYSEDVVVRLIGGFAEMVGREFRGHDAVFAWIRELLDMVGGRAQIEMLREVDDQVLMIATLVATGDASGAPATLRFGRVYSCRGGRISAVDSYYTADDARKAVGLGE